MFNVHVNLWKPLQTSGRTKQLFFNAIPSYYYKKKIFIKEKFDYLNISALLIHKNYFGKLWNFLKCNIQIVF